MSNFLGRVVRQTISQIPPVGQNDKSIKNKLVIPTVGKGSASVAKENSDVSANEALIDNALESIIPLKGSKFKYRNAESSAMRDEDNINILEQSFGLMGKTYGNLTVEAENPKNQNNDGDTLSAAVDESRKFLEIPQQQLKNYSNNRRRPPPPRRKWKADVGTNVPSKSFSQRRSAAYDKKHGQQRPTFPV